MQSPWPQRTLACKTRPMSFPLLWTIPCRVPLWMSHSCLQKWPILPWAVLGMRPKIRSRMQSRKSKPVKASRVCGPLVPVIRSRVPISYAPWAMQEALMKPVRLHPMSWKSCLCLPVRLTIPLWSLLRRVPSSTKTARAYRRLIS